MKEKDNQDKQLTEDDFKNKIRDFAKELAEIIDKADRIKNG